MSAIFYCATLGYSKAMQYVALLRGINVGGNNKVDMTRLKTVFESIDCSKVVTYINSGNVIFSDTRGQDELILLLENAIKNEFGFTVSVILRTFEQIETLEKKVPNDWTNDVRLRTDIMFLWDSIDDATILQKIVINPAIENVMYLPGALVWNIARENVTKGYGVKLVKSDIYKQMTIRNINTVRALYKKMQNNVSN